MAMRVLASRWPALAVAEPQKIIQCDLTVGVGVVEIEIPPLARMVVTGIRAADRA